MHSELRGWRRCLIITSALHMPRTRAIFEWVFALPPHRKKTPQLDYEAVGDEATGALAPEAAAARCGHKTCYCGIYIYPGALCVCVLWLVSYV